MSDHIGEKRKTPHEIAPKLKIPHSPVSLLHYSNKNTRDVCKKQKQRLNLVLAFIKGQPGAAKQPMALERSRVAANSNSDARYPYHDFDSNRWLQPRHSWRSLFVSEQRSANCLFSNEVNQQSGKLQMRENVTPPIIRSSRSFFNASKNRTRLSSVVTVGGREFQERCESQPALIYAYRPFCFLRSN
ncbi:hypothetical protein J6590_043196 [Homalodisca vitripennis]|nr:hypothetical protein J6590_043196 [Homalodisca vitripennis]